jgi:hypothetical protein
MGNIVGELFQYVQKKEEEEKEKPLINFAID